MKKKIIALALLATVAMSSVAVMTGCFGGTGDDITVDAVSSEIVENTSSQNETVVSEVKENKLGNLEGMHLPKAMDLIKEEGYTASYYADGVDFTDFIDALKEDYVVGSAEVNTSDKTVKIDLALISNIEADKMQEDLEAKLAEGTAWVAAEEYGQDLYGNDFDLNYLVGKITADAEDADTWFLKAECSLYGVDMICEAEVTGTTDSPEVVRFEIY